ncbi:MAG: phosphomannomutase, partial [Patescibacteria group bacterium]
MDKKIFRAYDIRGKYPDELNQEAAAKIAGAYALRIKPKTVVVGRDLRVASQRMFDAVAKALLEQGVNVKDAGQMTNPMISYAVFNYGFDGGIILSASHNPIGYGGMKMFKKGAETLPGDDQDLIKIAFSDMPAYLGPKGKLEKIDIIDDYLKFVRSQIDIANLKPQKILFDTCYGSVSLVLDKLLDGLPAEKIELHTKPDANFGGLPEPNPQNLEVQKEAVQLAKNRKPDFAVMWDGDGDRVFFLDEKGEFVPAPYITAVLIEAIAEKHPKAKIVSDPRVIWPIAKAAQKTQCQHIISKSGYRFMKETMIKNQAVFGAEMTAHYFFRETEYTDNGLIPFLMIWEILSTTGNKLSELVAPYRRNHFILDEKKFPVENPTKI